jgi:hypothetical protein
MHFELRMARQISSLNQTPTKCILVCKINWLLVTLAVRTQRVRSHAHLKMKSNQKLTTIYLFKKS